MTLEIAILGCGSSAGVPRVGQGFGACDPHNPRNHRRRCSILVEKPGPHGATRVLVDAGPDVRMQLIDAGVDRLDALLLNHPHADHIHGLDDVRPLTMQMRRMIDCYLDAPTWDTVGHRFAYLFKTPSGSAYPPLLVPHLVAPGAAVAPEGPAGALEALPFRLNHGDIDALGYRFENVAYTPDVKAIPDESSEFLEDL
jgi:phosphoribosyl 1,2-cyclic phosphate phosphodiesterase